MKRITTVLATILSLAFTPLAAQDYDNGVEAYNTSDYQTALQEWRPLADQGDASAQFVLLCSRGSHPPTVGTFTAP